jgi:CRISPR-associated protein Cas5d
MGAGPRQIIPAQTENKIMRSAPVCLRVAGNFACFTRPEFHVERVSYPVITPSAARGIFEAILMKPIEKPEADKRHNKIGFRWVITRIGIVKKGTFFSIHRGQTALSASHRPAPRSGALEFGQSTKVACALSSA